MEPLEPIDKYFTPSKPRVEHIPWRTPAMTAYLVSGWCLLALGLFIFGATLDEGDNIFDSFIAIILSLAMSLVGLGFLILAWVMTADYHKRLRREGKKPGTTRSAATPR